MADQLLRRLRLRIRRGFVWFPCRCIDCKRWHLNSFRVYLPMCVSCFDEYMGHYDRTAE